MEDNFKHKGRRRILASELREKGIKDQRILSAIENIPRHLFIDPGLSEQAYIDKALPIENDQTISQPYTVAFQTQLLNPSASEKILEIGVEGEKIVDFQSGDLTSQEIMEKFSNGSEE